MPNSGVPPEVIKILTRKKQWRPPSKKKKREHLSPSEVTGINGTMFRTTLVLTLHSQFAVLA
jgi:hypothetical protein